MNKPLVLAPAFYPSALTVWRLTRSAAYHSISLHLYGVGQQYTGWIQTHVSELIMELLKATETHFLFTDAIDAFFCSTLDEIMLKYKSLGKPPLLASWEPSGMNAGGFIGERLYMIERLKEIAQGYESGDPQVRWREHGGFVTDDKSLIFQTTSEGQVDWLLVDALGRFNNTHTNTQPCIIHVCGGYVDPIEFRNKQVQPLWGLCEAANA